MSEGTDNGTNVSRRARRIEEAVLEVEGVAGVRVWELPGRVEVGVRVAPSGTHSDVLQRVSESIAGMRVGEEVWEFGVLTEALG